MDQVSPDPALEELKRRHVADTGSDDFDTPRMASQVRQLSGLTEATPEELYDAGIRALDDQGITGADRDRAVERIKVAVGMIS